MPWRASGLMAATAAGQKFEEPDAPSTGCMMNVPFVWVCYKTTGPFWGQNKCCFAYLFVKCYFSKRDIHCKPCLMGQNFRGWIIGEVPPTESEESANVGFPGIFL